MGFFGTYLYDGQQWAVVEPDRRPAVAGHWLMVDIHDSDFTTITYGPAGVGSGVAFLGETPRTYFENEAASAPTDVAREAAGLAAWWATLHEHADAAAVTRKQARLAQYLAEDIDPSHPRPRRRRRRCRPRRRGDLRRDQTQPVPCRPRPAGA